MITTDVEPKSRKARKVTLHEMTFNPPRPSLGVMAYSKGKSVAGHKHKIPEHLLKAIEARRKHTLTSLIG